MFDNLRNKFRSVVQDGINFNSVVRRKLSQVQSPKSDRNENGKGAICEKINYFAGSSMLAKYQKEWIELHTQAEKNAEMATRIDQLMVSVNGNLTKQLRDFHDLNSSLSSLPKIMQTMDQCIDNINNLSKRFATVEDELIKLESLIEKCDYNMRKDEQRLQVAMYKEKKMMNLKEKRAVLLDQKAAAVKEAELKQKVVLQQRQEIALEAFLRDMTLYKEQGELPKIIVKPVENKVKLEEIQLETDNTAELDQFLEE